MSLIVTNFVTYNVYFCTTLTTFFFFLRLTIKYLGLICRKTNPMVNNKKKKKIEKKKKLSELYKNYRKVVHQSFISL
jgi:hypothetical protein